MPREPLKLRTVPSADGEAQPTAPPDEYDPRTSSRFTRIPNGDYELGFRSCVHETPYGRATASSCQPKVAQGRGLGRV